METSTAVLGVVLALLSCFVIWAYIGAQKKFNQVMAQQVEQLRQIRQEFAITGRNLRIAYAARGLCPICHKPMRRKDKLTTCSATGQVHPDTHPWGVVGTLPQYSTEAMEYRPFPQSGW